MVKYFYIFFHFEHNKYVNQKLDYIYQKCFSHHITYYYVIVFFLQVVHKLCNIPVRVHLSFLGKRRSWSPGDTITSLSPQKVMQISRFDEIFVAKCANIFRLCSTLDYLRMFCVPFGHKPCVLKIPLLWPKATRYDIGLTTKIRMFRKRSIPLENHLWPSRLRYISTLRYCILHTAQLVPFALFEIRRALLEALPLRTLRAFFLPLLAAAFLALSSLRRTLRA